MAAHVIPPQHAGLPISPLSLDQLTRDVWGSYDAYAIAHLAPLAQEACYQPKFYKAPLSSEEVLPAFGFVQQGLQITPGSILYGFYLPSDPPNFQPPQWNLQIKNQDTGVELWDVPIPSFFIANFRVTYQSALAFPATGQTGSAPNLLCSPYPITGSGLLLVSIWETSGAQQRIELVLGVLELVAP